jgi:ribosomal-protein-alanine N-acetyltransferase
MMRPAVAADCAALATLSSEAGASAWSARSFEEELERATSELVVATESETIVGFVATSVVADESELLNVAVGLPWRRRGLGGALVRYAMDRAVRRGATAMHLEVRAGNRAARALYEALGFEVSGVRRGYYPDGEDAVCMSRTLARPCA